MAVLCHRPQTRGIVRFAWSQNSGGGKDRLLEYTYININAIKHRRNRNRRMNAKYIKQIKKIEYI